MCHQCEGQSLQVIPEEEASNCNLDDNFAGTHSYIEDCTSEPDENSISSSTDVHFQSTVDSNLLETSTFDSFDNSLDYSASGSTKSDINAIDAIKHNMCQNCDIGFALSDDLLSCIGEWQEW